MKMNINPSWLTVCNNALSRINVPIIEDIGEGGNSANLCKELLPICIGEILNVRPWRSARKRIRITPMAETPAFGFKYQYELPMDFVRIVSIDMDNEEWEREGNRILAARDVMNLVYIAIPDNTENLSPLLISAISARLASKLAPSLIGDMNLGQVFFQESVVAIQMATTEEDAGRKDEMTRTNDWREAFNG